MKVHANLKELLEAWEERRLEITFNNDYHAAKTMLKDFIASNSLASVEPEPLAKNKQTENENVECEHSWSFKPILQQYNCRKCGKWR